MFSLSLASHQPYFWKFLNSKIKTQEGRVRSHYLYSGNESCGTYISDQNFLCPSLCVCQFDAKTDLSVQKWCLAGCHPLHVRDHRKHHSTKLLLPRANMYLKTGLFQASKCNPNFSAGPRPACSNLSSCKDITKVVGQLSWAVLPFPSPASAPAPTSSPGTPPTAQSKASSCCCSGHTTLAGTFWLFNMYSSLQQTLLTPPLGRSKIRQMEESQKPPAGPYSDENQKWTYIDFLAPISPSLLESFIDLCISVLYLRKRHFHPSERHT